jgi:hypothetical protein
VGIALVFPILGKWMIIFTADFNKWGRERMEILIPKRKFWFAGDSEQKGEPDFEVLLFCLVLMVWPCMYCNIVRDITGSAPHLPLLLQELVAVIFSLLSRTAH